MTRKHPFMRDISYDGIVMGTIIDNIFRRTLYRFPFDEYFFRRYQLVFPTIVLLELTEFKINDIEVWDDKLKQTYLTNVDTILSKDGEIVTWNGVAFRSISIKKVGVVRKKHFV